MKMRTLICGAMLVLVAGAVGAVDVPFRDGTVVEVASYTVTGSYVMLEMPNGARVAYDIADIDVEALRAAEAAAAEPVEEAVEETATLGRVGALTVPEATPEETGGIVITDRHVKHVRGSGISGPEDGPAETPADESAVPDGYEEGGGVLLNNVSVSPLDGGRWEVTGEVINRTSDSVLDVRANLQAAVPEGDPWTASVPVSGIMSPDEKGTFSHVFSAPDDAAEGWAPQVQVSVVWMKGESRLEPNYDRVAPHPSGLPQDRGGVGGADVVEGPTEPID
jgi:hypothetical protein